MRVIRTAWPRFVARQSGVEDEVVVVAEPDRRPLIRNISGRPEEVAVLFQRAQIAGLGCGLGQGAECPVQAFLSVGGFVRC
jgi:hypothetical protein